MKQTIWLSCDLNLRGDYKSLYAWLNENDARECGDSLAVLQYEYSNDLVQEITRDLTNAVPDIASARVYLFFRDPETHRMKGRFLFRQRHRSPWFGYAPDKNSPILDHEKVPFDFIDSVMETIRQTPQHTCQILTKRPARMERYFVRRDVPKNAWLGVSVENQRHGVPRIDALRRIHAGVRFLSCAPLLEDLGQINLREIHWVIRGGESGKKARPMQKEWAENIRQQCAAERVAFFFKQWGAFGEDGVKRAKKANGRLFNKKEWNAFPKVRSYA